MAAQVVDSLRKAFRSGVTRPLSWRIANLKAIRRFLVEKENEICQAVHDDLHKPTFETKVTEIAMAHEEISTALKGLKKWVQPKGVSRPSPKIIWALDTLQMLAEPFGVVLIIAPWNYPIQLSIMPIIGAIAAGNCVLLKPSELSSNTEKLLVEELPKYLDTNCFTIMTGGVEETSAILEQKFDHIFFTGSTNVGKIVMRAASNHLTPVTLELGGKSPVIIDSTCDMKVAAKRIAWGKSLNAGQSCIAPDYILALPGVEEPFIAAYKEAIEEMMGEDPAKSESFGRIISDSHFKRLAKMLDGADVAFGGQIDAESRYIAPTILKGVDLEDAVMQEEIFGPILPIVTVEALADALDIVNDRPKPLALYVFSSDKKVINQVKFNTSSGSFLSNDTMVQASCNTLPFGGVGESGVGGYHGRHSFDAFSHHKPVVHKMAGLEIANDVRYPPYDDKKLSTLQFLLSYPK